MALPTKPALAAYIRRMRAIKAQAMSGRNPIGSAEFDEYVLGRFFPEQHKLSKPAPPAPRATEAARKYRPIVTGLLVLTLLLLVRQQHQQLPLTGLFMLHIQTIIHPAMSWWRHTTLPLLRALPALGDLYDESCLLHNPLFHIHGMDCAPCAEVRSCLQWGAVVTRAEAARLVEGGGGGAGAGEGGEGGGGKQGAPVMFRVAGAERAEAQLSVDGLYELYANWTQEYRENAYVVRSSDPRITNLEQMFAAFAIGPNATGTATPSPPPSHSLWRLNRMSAARLLRTVLGRTAVAQMPRTGMHIERYVALDPAASAHRYRLPDMECARVFVAQLAGGRTMVLRPSAECTSHCKTVSVHLSAGSVLLYDWWYWRPVSVPDPLVQGTSISYIGAYC